MTTGKGASTRRAWLGAGVGVAIAAGAAGLVLRRSRQQARELTVAEQAFWQQKFKRLDGSELAMGAFKGQPLILNFWATWCPPCVEELPLLNAFFSENQRHRWQVLGLAVDQPTAVARFLGQSPLSFPIALAGFAGVEVSRSLGNLSGGLPFTVVFAASGEVLNRKMGRVSPADLQAWQQSAAV